MLLQRNYLSKCKIKYDFCLDSMLISFPLLLHISNFETIEEVPTEQAVSSPVTSNIEESTTTQKYEQQQQQQPSPSSAYTPPQQSNFATSSFPVDQTSSKVWFERERERDACYNCRILKLFVTGTCRRCWRIFNTSTRSIALYHCPYRIRCRWKVCTQWRSANGYNT